MSSQSTTDISHQFLNSLSDYSECIRPYLRTAQNRYAAGYYLVEGQAFDFNSYCKRERDLAHQAMQRFKQEAALPITDQE